MQAPVLAPVPASSPSLNPLVAELPAPATMAMAQRARALRAEGHPVISLALGEPDFDTPAHVVEAAHAAARRGETRYPPNEGTPALKRALRDKFARENGLEFAADEVMVSAGGKQVLFNALAATLRPGDEVVIPSPYWASYPLTVRMFDARPVFVACDEADGFRLRADRLADAITPRTRWVILNFPGNPTGAAMGAADLAAVAAVLERHPGLWVLSDEIYERLCFGAEPHRSLAAIAPGLRSRVLTLAGVSKTYAMTGWRIGFAGGPRELIRAMAIVQGNATSGACSVSQAAALAALEGPQDIVATMRDTYRRRRDMVVSALQAIPGITCAEPEGAFYAYPGIAGLLGRTTPGGRRLDTDEDVAAALLEEAHLATVPGTAFGYGPHLRLSFAASDADLAESCRRLAGFRATLD